ncbi:MAG: hypothetical protein MJZ81_10845 [Bacteroidales bacterium]|nr:hypothetical protein [Bacteroidales bacterium]
MATEAEVIEVYDQFDGHNMYTIAAMLRQAAEILDGVLNEITVIEKMPTANLDGAFENQNVNVARLLAKIAFYDKVKKIVGEVSNE